MCQRPELQRDKVTLPERIARLGFGEKRENIIYNVHVIAA